jgi:hypothetical protein
VTENFPEDGSLAVKMNRICWRSKQTVVFHSKLNNYSYYLYAYMLHEKLTKNELFKSYCPILTGASLEKSAMRENFMEFHLKSHNSTNLKSFHSEFRENIRIFIDPT